MHFCCRIPTTEFVRLFARDWIWVRHLWQEISSVIPYASCFIILGGSWCWVTSLPFNVACASELPREIFHYRFLGFMPGLSVSLVWGVLSTSVLLRSFAGILLGEEFCQGWSPWEHSLLGSLSLVNLHCPAIHVKPPSQTNRARAVFEVAASTFWFEVVLLTPQDNWVHILCFGYVLNLRHLTQTGRLNLFPGSFPWWVMWSITIFHGVGENVWKILGLAKMRMFVVLSLSGPRALWVSRWGCRV